jgi:Domain of unknown function (DUF1707)
MSPSTGAAGAKGPAQATPYGRPVPNELTGGPGGGAIEPSADLRVSDADRDRVVGLLQAAVVDGRLTTDELDGRLEAALKARTRGELLAVTSDLAAGSLEAVQEPAEAAQIDCRGSRVKRTGPWLVPRRLTVNVLGGAVTLDFTEAVITHSSLVISVDLTGSKLALVTKPGLVVDPDSLSLDGSAVKVRAPWGSETPTSLRIQLLGKVTGSKVSAGPARVVRFGRRRT